MKTVKVRVAVGVSKDGSWNACGSNVFDDKEAMRYAVDPLEEGEWQYYLTAELRVPETEEVSGVVEVETQEPTIEDLEYSMTTTVCKRQGKIYCVACGQTLNENVPEVCSNCGRRIVQ